MSSISEQAQAATNVMDILKDPGYLDEFLTSREGNVYCLRNLPEEVIAVLFAYFSRSKYPLRDSLDAILHARLEERNMLIRRMKDRLTTAFLAEHMNQRTALEGEMFKKGREFSDMELSEMSTDKARELAEFSLNRLLKFDLFNQADEKAAAFHDKWVVGYGHASVAEHATVHVAVENCTILGAKMLEDARLAAFTEKSTRFVDFRDMEPVHPSKLGVPSEYHETFLRIQHDLLRAYGECVDETIEYLHGKYDKAEDQSEAAWKQQVKTKAYDLCRGLLSAGMPTSLGMTFNARHMGHSISKWASHELQEMRDLSKGLLAECSKVVPTLLKYTEGKDTRQEILAEVDGILAGKPWHREHDAQVISAVTVKNVDSAYRLLAVAILEDLYREKPDMNKLSLSLQDCENIIRAYVKRHHLYDQPGRALEMLDVYIDVTTDFGAWRDLQRHRIMSHFNGTPVLAPGLGYYVPEEFSEIPSTKDKYEKAIAEAARAWFGLPSDAPWAQYTVPLATNVRWHGKANLRQTMYLCERRSEKQGHIVYRRVAQRLAESVQVSLPIFAEPGMWKIDYAERPFARNLK